MLKYIFRRILIFIPALFFVSLITFFLAAYAPGDPVETILGGNNAGQGISSDKISSEKTYLELRKQLGFDKPLFYFTLCSSALPDTLYRIPNAGRKEAMERMALRTCNWNAVSDYYLSLTTLLTELYRFPEDSSDGQFIHSAIRSAEMLLTSADEEDIRNRLLSLDTMLATNKSMRSLLSAVKNSENIFLKTISESRSFEKYIPAIYFHGFDNQYHHWLRNFLKGDFGVSYKNRRPVASIVSDAIYWTLLLSTLAILISYFIAIPLGVFSAVKKGTRSERWLSTFLFMIHSIPNFWIATLAILFLCGGDYLNLFPPFGISTLSADSSILLRVADTAWHLILPLACWSYATLAYLSRQVRGGMLGIIGNDFIRTARAKGLPERTVIWKHTFRNSLLPLITIFAGIFPAVISGSFVIEYLFSIPGMGRITYEAILSRDYPVVFTVMLFASLLTMTGMLIADILIAAADPRISFSKEKSPHD